ncbi:MAG: hypothetical protein Q8P41_30015 [Pseudomonadota bacterium]|nr:hypothetical protein [Pseudomonadota bacterium]
MAKNTGSGHRIGSVTDRTQTQTPSGNWVKRETGSGRFIEQKQGGEPFKGVAKESDGRRSKE